RDGGGWGDGGAVGMTGQMSGRVSGDVWLLAGPTGRTHAAPFGAGVRLSGVRSGLDASRGPRVARPRSPFDVPPRFDGPAYCEYRLLVGGMEGTARCRRPRAS